MQENVFETSYGYYISKFDKFKSVFHNILSFLGNFLFLFLVAVIVIILIYSLYIKKNGTNGQAPLVSSYVIISPSMVPTINVEDVVVACRPHVESLKKGDIITFTSTDARYTGLTVTHRIQKVTKNELGKLVFQTKGDNNTTPDDAVVFGENIYGKVILVLPWLGYLQYFLTKSYGWLLLVVLPCIGIIIYDIFKLSKTVKRSKVMKEFSFKDIEILDIGEEQNNMKEEEKSSQHQDYLFSIHQNHDDIEVLEEEKEDSDIELL